MAGKRKQNKFNRGDFLSVCAAVRTYWLSSKKIPELDQLDVICDVPRQKIAAVLVHEDFMQAMEDTGVPVRSQKGLNILQHHALVIMTDPLDTRPFHIRLKESGISSATWKAWLRNPIFASFLEQFYENALGDHMNAAHLSLMKQVDKGNVPALNLYYSMTGRYDPRSQQERDLTAVISGLMEILQRKLDPIQLGEISEEIQTLMGGGRKAIEPTYRSEQVVDSVVIDTEELRYEDGERYVKDPTGPLIEFEELREEKYVSELWEVHSDSVNKEAFLDAGGAAVSFDTSLFDNP